MKKILGIIAIVTFFGANGFAYNGACLQAAQDTCTEYSTPTKDNIDSMKRNCELIGGQWANSCSGNAFCKKTVGDIDTFLFNFSADDSVKALICNAAQGTAL